MRTKKPDWLKVKLSDTSKYNSVNEIIKRHRLNTVCQGANCPNRLTCYSKKTATFLILGDTCTRNCKFCNIENKTPTHVDIDEPLRVAEAVLELELKYAVITSVTRDDLIDGGSSQFVAVIKAIKSLCKGVAIEVLIPDFLGDNDALKGVCLEGPDVLNHNIETVPRLYQAVRPEADYERSLKLLNSAKQIDPLITTKSGMMLGLGERDDEVKKVLSDLRENQVDIITMGQYLPPSNHHYPVADYVSPEKFDFWAEYARSLGFSGVMCGPLVRSSYLASELKI